MLSSLLNELRSDQVLQVEGLVPFFLRKELALFNDDLMQSLAGVIALVGHFRACLVAEVRLEQRDDAAGVHQEIHPVGVGVQRGGGIALHTEGDLVRLAALYAERALQNPAAVVDCNHSNSNKQFREQIRIAGEVMHSRKYNPALKTLIKGLMIESYLVEGCQPITAGRTYGKSITDPCLGWADTEKLLYTIAEQA